MRAASLLVCASALLGCGDEESYIVVTVKNRPAVHNATALRVTLANGGTMRTDELQLGATAFPVTFSISAPGRAGELGIHVDAVDSNGLLVGRGTSTTTLAAETAQVMLESADFVVNTDFADDQFPSDYFDTHGVQAASLSDGRWTVAFRDRCASPCNMMARQFDASGRPVSTQVAASTNAFPMSTNLTTGFTTPAIAGAGTTTIEMWNFRVPSPGTGAGIACRALDGQGRAMPDQLEIAEVSTDLVAIAPMSNNNFAATWIGLSPIVIRSAIVKPDCTLLAPGAPVTVSTTAGPTRPSVAANGTPPTLLYAWVVSGAVYVRLANATNQLQGASDIQFLPPTATEEVEFVRVAPLGNGFAVIVRWASNTNFTGPGRIELYRTNAMGAVLGQPIQVTTKSGSDFASREAFGVTTRASDGMLFITWHACETSGDGQGCGVWGRAFRSDGSPVGDEIPIPTTTGGDQTSPSVAALADAFVVTWKDDSMQAPDVSGSAVRARIIYPGATDATQ